MEARLSSNGIRVKFGRDTFAPLSESMATAHHPSALRDKYSRTGYVFIRGLLPSAPIEALRDRYVQLLRNHVGDLPAHGVEGHPAHTLVRESIFDEFVQQSELKVLAERLLGGPVLSVRRSILRHFDGGTQVASRAHRDQDYFRASRDLLTTMWIPLVDVPLAGGSLVLLEDSEDLDVEQLRQKLDATCDRRNDKRPISPDLAAVAQVTGRRWLFSNFRVGDVVALSPRMVHASLDCGQGSMRLSVDARFIHESGQIAPSWTRPWSGDDGA